MKRSILLIFMAAGFHGVVAGRGDPERPTVDAAVDAGDLFRKGDRLARMKDYQGALDAWRRAYLEKLPEYRDLEFLHPVGAKMMTREKLGEFLLGALAREYPDEKFEADRVAYSHFGFFGPDLDLKEVTVAILTAEIAGFYDTDTKGLYLIRHEESPAKKKGFWERLLGWEDKTFDPDEERAVLAHEMAHALADQHFDLHSMLHSVAEDDDMTLAYAAVVEGEAMLVMLVDMTEDRESVLENAGIFANPLMEFVISLGVAFGGGKEFRRAPLLLRESLFFPYLKGLAFCNQLTARGGWEAVNAAFRHPPTSTEQILHPEKYEEATRDDPMSLSFEGAAPLLPDDWKLAKANVLGEFAIEVLLRPKLGFLKSRAAAAGWDGDLFHVYRSSDAGRSRTCLAWATTWDSDEEAAEFASALIEYQDKNAGAESDGERPELPDDLPRAERLWTRSQACSGIWRRGSDVFLVDRVPSAELANMARWCLKIERQPKQIRFKRFPSQVRFPESGEERSRPTRTFLLR